MRTLAIVPARSGSKGIKNKNICQINGKTLIEWAISVGMNTPLITDIYISTDSLDYERIALAAGAKSLGMRPKNLSIDTAKTVDVALDMLFKLKQLSLEYNFLLLLQPTVPQRNSQEVTAIFDRLIHAKADAAVSISLFEEPHPYKLKVINKEGIVVPFLKNKSSEVSRQNFPQVYRLTGAYYLIKTEALIRSNSFLPDNTTAFVTDPVVNIDTKEDLMLLNFLASRDPTFLAN